MPHPQDLNPAAELGLVSGFADVTPAAIAELSAIVTQRRAAAGDLLAVQGQVPSGLLVLVRGAAKAVRTIPTDQGQSGVVLEVMRPSSLLADPGLMDGLPSDFSIVALRASHLFILERRALLALASVHPSVGGLLFSRFIRECRSGVRRIDELASGTVEERVLRLLEGLSAQHGTPVGQGRFIAIPLRRRDIASMVNATTETVSRLFARFEREGRARSRRDGIWWRGVAKSGPVLPADSEPPGSLSPLSSLSPLAPAAASSAVELVRRGLR